MGKMIDIAAVCELLGRSRTWFWSHREALFAEGFPRPVAVLGLYSEEAVMRWLASSVHVVVAPPGSVPPAEDSVDSAFGL